MMEYHGIILAGSSPRVAGRTLGGPRLRTAAKRAGFDLLIADYVYNLTHDEIFELLKKNVTSKTKVLGFSHTWYEPGLYDIHWAGDPFLEKIKKTWPHVLIVTGNQINKVLVKSDYHFYGMADYSFVEFLKKIHDQPSNVFIQKPIGSHPYIIDSNTSNPITNMDDTDTEFIIEDYVHPHDTMPLEISRGCIFTCAFCRYPFQGKKSFEFIRSPENVAREIRNNYELFGITRYNIMDSTFNDTILKLELLKKALEIAKLPKFEFCCFIKPEMIATKGNDMIPKLIDMGLVGAFMGIESLDNQSRKAMNKGMDINRILDASYKLVEDSKHKIKICASMIVGLSNDTPDMMYKTQEFFVKEQDKLFTHWLFTALDIRLHNKAEFIYTLSDMEKDPEKFGYELSKGGYWKNKHMDYTLAKKIAQELKAMDSKVCRPGGWAVPMAWFLNKSEEEMLTIPTGSYWNDYTSAMVADSRRRYELAMAR